VLNAFVALDEAGAVAAARRADATRGKSCPPLLGVPIVVKDNIEVARMPNSGGTPALKDYRPKVDGTRELVCVRHWPWTTWRMRPG
jgi:Asp-tRNA(Asn)/Glu-tRNA(Gln) amidotransferase A subunit family amidase